MNATPPQGINRDALRAVLRDIDTDAYFDQRKPLDEQVDRILALVRPVEGITLTREEAREALAWIEVENDQTRALIAKLRSGDAS